MAAFAQPVPPYDVAVYGTVANCDPNASNFVTVATTPGTLPEFDIDVPVDANCMFLVNLPMETMTGGYVVTVPCGGSTISGIFPYSVNALFLDSTVVVVNLACNIGACTACINMDNPSPFTAVYSSCSSGGTGPYTYLWDFSDTGAEPGNNVTHVYSGPGEYTVCLDVVDGNGISCNTCDTVYVDANGGVGFDQPAPCSANFTATQGFANGSTVPFGVEVISIEANNIGGPTPTVDWGDGNTTVIGPHLYAAAGTYTVCVNATNPQGVTCSSCRQITIDANGTLSTSTQTPPFQLQVQIGMIGGCNPGTIVRLQSIQGTLPVFEIDYVLDSTCSNIIDVLEMTSSSGWIQATYFCDTETTTSALAYDFGGGSGGVGFFFSSCPGPVDCLGVLGGTASPGTLCSTPGNGEGTWSANCECVPNLPCQAGFWVMQAYTNGDSTNTGGTTVEPIPFELWIWNLSSGGTGNYSFAWDFGDGNSSTEAFPTHVYAASGPYTLCLTITDDAGCTSTFCDEISVDQDGILGMGTGFDARSVLTIRVIQELPTGITERPALNATNLWPNPVAEEFNLTLNSSRSGNLTMTIVDLNGREVRTMNASVMAGSNQLPMDVSGLEQGMYVLRLSNGSNSTAMRFVKH